MLRCARARSPLRQSKVVKTVPNVNVGKPTLSGFFFFAAFVDWRKIVQFWYTFGESWIFMKSGSRKKLRLCRQYARIPDPQWQGLPEWGPKPGCFRKVFVRDYREYTHGTPHGTNPRGTHKQDLGVNSRGNLLNEVAGKEAFE